EIETFAEELQYVAIFEAEFTGDAHVHGVVGVAGVIVTRHAGQQAAPPLSQQVESEAAPLPSIRRAERDASDDEGSRGIRPAGLGGEDFAHAEVADQAVAERIAVLAEGQVPDGARDQAVTLVGGGAGAILLDGELVSDIEAAEGALVATSAAVAGASHVLCPGQSVSEMELKSLRQPPPRLQQESVIPAQAQRAGHVDLAQIGIRSRKVYAPNVGGRTGEHGNSADDASSEWHRKRTPVWKLVSAREVWWGKIGIESERQTVSLGINIAGREDDATKQQLL